ncbi:unnamed protein product, partial [Iphiclides podalirius]
MSVALDIGTNKGACEPSERSSHSECRASVASTKVGCENGHNSRAYDELPYCKARAGRAGENTHTLTRTRADASHVKCQPARTHAPRRR